MEDNGLVFKNCFETNQSLVVRQGNSKNPDLRGCWQNKTNMQVGIVCVILWRLNSCVLPSVSLLSNVFWKPHFPLFFSIICAILDPAQIRCAGSNGL